MWFTSPFNHLHDTPVTGFKWFIAYQDINPLQGRRYILQNLSDFIHIVALFCLIIGKAPRTLIDCLPSLIRAIVKSHWLKAAIRIKQRNVKLLIFLYDEVLIFNRQSRKIVIAQDRARCKVWNEGKFLPFHLWNNAKVTTNRTPSACNRSIFVVMNKSICCFAAQFSNISKIVSEFRREHPRTSRPHLITLRFVPDRTLVSIW